VLVGVLESSVVAVSDEARVLVIVRVREGCKVGVLVKNEVAVKESRLVGVVVSVRVALRVAVVVLVAVLVRRLSSSRLFAFGFDCAVAVDGSGLAPA
jgi:hypothetical protein